MLMYSIILNILLLLVTIVLSMYYKTKRKQAQQLFIRSWYLETHLIDIYKHCDEETQNRIEDVLNKIKPL